MKPGAEWIRSWKGGRVRLARGKEVFVIERRIGNGQRRVIALHVDTEKEAEAEWALFDRDPINYRTRREHAQERERTGEGVRLDAETLAEFLAYAQKLVDREELTQQYKTQTLAPYLGWWAKKLDGRELAKVHLADLKRFLKGVTAEHKRIVALKSFTAWLREEDRLKRKDDPTLDLKTPAIVPGKSVKAKGYPIALIEQLYSELPSQLARDTLRLRAVTGMHDTEIDRIASGKATLRKIEDPSGIAGVIVFAHLKKGKAHAISVDADTFAAAERLQARGHGVSRNAMRIMVDRACRRLKLTTGTPAVEKGEPTGFDTIHPGELRHSFATWATTVGKETWPVNQQGVDLVKVAESMGHLSKRTTSVFYVGDRIPMMIAIPITLTHPQDPGAEAPEAAATVH